jgi:hypothetical protein
MLVAWDDALALLAHLAEPEDEQLRDGVLFLGAHRPTLLPHDLGEDVVHDALLALGDVGYVEWRDWSYSSGGVTIQALRVTGRGMQALGQWPALYSVLTPASLAHLLEDLAAYAADPEKEAILRDAAEHARGWVKGTLRESVLAVATAAFRARYGPGP